MKNNAFYIGKNGNQIMNTNNFSKEIIRYLNYEQAYISKILAKKRYCTLIELGCDEVRLHGNCAMNEVKYIGVDIRDNLKASILEDLSKNRHVESRFINSCLSEFHELNPVLCVFPFNLIGNLEECKSQTKKCFSRGFDIVISQFNTTSDAKSIRYEYYKNCGISNLFFKKTKEGDIFRGIGFESKSYNNGYLIECCKNVGDRHIDHYESELITIHYFSGSKM